MVDHEAHTSESSCQNILGVYYTMFQTKTLVIDDIASYKRSLRRNLLVDKAQYVLKEGRAGQGEKRQLGREELCLEMQHTDKYLMFVGFCD